MKRKIVKLGPSTSVISLPAKWLNKYNVKKGDEIEIIEEGNNLRISPDIEYKIKKETIDLNDINIAIKRIVASKYLKGSDEIEVLVNSLDKSRIVQKRVEEMIGMEIIEQSKNKLLIKNMGTGDENNFDSILLRVLHLLNTMSDETMNAINNKDTDLEYLEDMEKNINKFTDYCFRLLNKKGHYDTQKTAVFYCILFLLEELGDEYKKLVHYIKENKLQLDYKLAKLFSSINEFHKSFQSAYLKFSLSKAVDLSKKRDIIINDIENKIRKNKIKDEIIILKNFESIVDTMIKVIGQLYNIH